MLINFDADEVLYVIGTGISARGIQQWIQSETQIEVKLIERWQLTEISKNSQCVVGFNSMDYRLMLLSDPACENIRWITYIHPSSNIATSMDRISRGTVIDPMCHVGFETSIGKFGRLLPFCMVGHGTILGNNVVLKPNCSIGGSTNIGDNVTVGMGTIIKDKINICSDCEFLMNSVVTKNIDQPGRYYGNKRLSN